MKVYQCYKTYPSDSADVTIYVREWEVTGKTVVQFFPKDPLAEPFRRQPCETYDEAMNVAEEYISKENFVMVKVGQ